MNPGIVPYFHWPLTVIRKSSILNVVNFLEPSRSSNSVVENWVHSFLLYLYSYSKLSYIKCKWKSADFFIQKNYNYQIHLSFQINQDAEQWERMKNNIILKTIIKTKLYNKFIMSWTSMFKWATFREILLPSSGNVNDYVAHI